MTPIDRDELARLMGLMADDPAMIVPFLRAFGDRLAGVVRQHLRDLGRADLVTDRDEVDGLVLDVAFFLQERAAAWTPDGALPWNWGARGIRKLVADAIGHARADVEVDVLDLGPDTSWAAAPAEVGLEDLGADPVVALLRRALDTIPKPRDRAVHVEYRRQVAAGDRSPAHTVGAMYGLRADHVRQIDRRARQHLARLAATDPEFAPLAGLPWITGRRSPASGEPPRVATA
jgi:hypothetical protein